ncbi:MAG: hypothetical protein KME42_18485 [Tildeniella nuda ZEHNDER 1965/U140]|jgi:hypothetical protein|nr:hypothetical protein [Tildeniella nuda ZEHNDER 1965/U140]
MGQYKRFDTRFAHAGDDKHSLILSESAIVRIINRRFPNRSLNNAYRTQGTGRRKEAGVNAPFVGSIGFCGSKAEAWSAVLPEKGDDKEAIAQALVRGD